MNPFENLRGAPSSGGAGRSGHRLLRPLLPALALLLAAGCDFSPITNVGTEVEGLTGTLVTESGRPASGAWVRVHPVSPTMLARAATTSITTAATDSVRTGATGAFQFKDLPNGLYNLSASVRRGDTTLALFLASLHIVGDTNIGTDTLYRSGTIILQTRADGLSVPGAVCAIGDSPWLTFSDTSGMCILQGVAPGVYRITVSHPTYLKTITTDITVVTGDSVGAPSINMIDTSTVLLPPGAPTLVSPVGNALVEASSSLTWTGDGGWTGSRYIERQIIEVSQDSLFRTFAVRDTMIMNATISTGGTIGRGGLPLDGGKTYWWRVTLQNTAGSATSLRASFRTQSDNIVVVAASADLTISSAIPSLSDLNNLGTRNRGAEAAIGPGTYDAYTTSRTLIRFSLPAGTDAASIGSAIIRVTPSRWVSKDINASYTITLHRMLKSWKEGSGTLTANSASVDGATALERFWGSQDGSEDWATRFGGPNDIDALIAPAATLTKSFGATETWDFDVSTLVRAWAADTTKNFGVMMVSEFPGQSGPFPGYPEFHSREANVADESKPVLIITRTTSGGGGGGTVTISAMQDGGISGALQGASSNANNNYGRVLHFGVGVYNSETIGRGLVQFDVPANYAGKITKAVLSLHSYDWVSVGTPGATHTVYVHKMLKSWKEGSATVTAGQVNSATIDGISGLERFWGSQNGAEDWNRQLVGLDNIDAASVVSAQAAKASGYVGTWEFDVTSLAQQWAANPSQNFGLLLRADTPDTGPRQGDYPAFYTKDASVGASLKPRLILTVNP